MYSGKKGSAVGDFNDYELHSTPPRFSQHESARVKYLGTDLPK